MKLHRIDVEGFGALAELTLDQLAPEIQVLYGTNGSGKTTLLQFVRGVFCGFSDSHRLGLLPPAGDQRGGGSLKVRWDGDVCRFMRIADGRPASPLRVTLLRSDLETRHPRFDETTFRSDLIPVLFSAGAADVHRIDRLITQASRDGIQLQGRPEESERLQQTAIRVQQERVSLLEDGGKGEIAELEQERVRLQSELEQCARRWNDLCGQLPNRRASHGLRQAKQDVSRLRERLAAAESDLAEAQARSWEKRSVRRTAPQPLAPIHPPLNHLKPRRHDLGDVKRRDQLRAVDRRIDQARTLLAEVARAKLTIGLQVAQIAGSDDTPADAFVRQIRESLASLEAGLLELRDESAELKVTDRCSCREWQRVADEAVEEMGRRLYEACERVSRFELRHNKQLFASASATLGACEEQLLIRVDRLRSERASLLGASRHSSQWRGDLQAEVEHQFCECVEHEVRPGWPPVKASVAARPDPREPSIRYFDNATVRPSNERLARLRNQIEHLRQQLEAAVHRWRSVRAEQVSFSLPAAVEELEQHMDRTRLELAGVEERLAGCQRRWRVLSVTGEVIRRMIDRAESDRHPTVIQWASQYLREVTRGRYTGLSINPGTCDLEIESQRGEAIGRSALSRGTLDQVALSLRLALVRTYAARGIRFPLILDDVLVDTDQERLEAAVELLTRFAHEHSQQIVYLTCQAHLADRFEHHGAAVLTMPGSSPRGTQPVVPADMASHEFQGWVDRPLGRPAAPEQTPQTTAAHHGHRKQPRRLLKPMKRRQPDRPHWLSMDSSVNLVPSIGVQMGHRLAGLGVVSVADLIDFKPAEHTLRLESLKVSADRLGVWKSEAELLCCVPDLTGPAAQLLVQLGIRTPEALATADRDALLQRIATLGEQSPMQMALPDRETLERWIHAGQRARSLNAARRDTRRRRHSASRTSNRLTRSRHRRPDRRRGVPRRSGERPRRRQSPGTGVDSPPKPLDHSQPEEQEAIIAPFRTSGSSSKASDQPREWKFYLSPQSAVVDAPSIGPTTSKRLEKVGVITVADLLQRQAAEIAANLNHRRIKESTVLLWQQQSRLMCRIPQLRGHDAQVLVACGILEPEDVASMTPESLFAVIGPFVATAEGQRLLRSSKTPDLDEVTEWIHWARHSRQLRAA